MKRLLLSLLGLLCTQVCCESGQQVQQSPVSLVLQEGEKAELQCNFSTSTKQMQWFYQRPGGSLVSLLYNPSGTKQSGRLTSTTVAKERQSSLHISSSQTTDSGTYFCALDAQCSPHTCTLCTNIQPVVMSLLSHKTLGNPKEYLSHLISLSCIGRVVTSGKLLALYDQDIGIYLHCSIHTNHPKA
uniref:Ig-like domain-containing protein n=1 Tax=Rattus norvegicus TaxID=10116 RepID=A0ABK0L3L8_RAT